MKAESRFLTFGRVACQARTVVSRMVIGDGISQGGIEPCRRCPLVRRVYDASNTSVLIDDFFENAFHEMTRLVVQADGSSLCGFCLIIAREMDGFYKHAKSTRV